MSGQTYVTATRGDFGVVVTVYARGGAVVVRTTLSAHSEAKRPLIPIQAGH